MIESITEYAYSCTPIFKDMTPIQSMTVYIRAKDRREADFLFERYAHKFFDLDLRRSVQTFSGYQIVEDEV
jgi:hypothetical protein